MDALDRLVAIEEITTMRARMARCLDTKDWGGFAACFAVGAVLEAPEANLRWEGRDTITGNISAGMEDVRSVHHLHAPEIEIHTSDTASGVWAMADSLERTSADGVSVMNGYGHYHEKYTRGVDGWQVQTLRLERVRVDDDAGGR